MKMIIGSILLMAAGSAMNAGDLAGNYEMVGEREAASQLTLKPDGTFEFSLMYGAADLWGGGKWQHEKGAVILTSTSKVEPPFRLMRSATGKDDRHTRIWVIGQNGRGIANIKVILHGASGELVTQTVGDGLAEFPPMEGKREVVFRVQVYGVQTEPEVLKAADHDFYFEINGKGIQEFRFENQRAKVDGDTLELRMGDDEHALRYKKQ